MHQTDILDIRQCRGLLDRVAGRIAGLLGHQGKGGMNRFLVQPFENA
jgi:hypothetical protein